MKHITKHLLDCGIGAAIAFLTAISVMDEFTTKALLAAFAAAVVVGLIKYREYLLAGKNKAGYIFF